MLNAFLYDFKKELKRNLGWRNLTCFQKIVLAAVGISVILYLTAAIFAWIGLLILSALMLIVSLVIANCKDAIEKKLDKGISGDEGSRICAQTKWFRNKKVAIVKKMLDSNNTGLVPSKCVDLLLVECEDRLNSTRPSEVIRKRIKPIIAPITIIILSLITAWINIMIPGTNISFEGSFSQHILSVMEALANNIVLSRTLMVSFVVICVYATALYLAIVFVIIPAVLRLADRDFLLTAELKNVLLYIKHDDLFVKQEEIYSRKNDTCLSMARLRHGIKSCRKCKFMLAIKHIDINKCLK